MRRLRNATIRVPVPADAVRIAFIEAGRVQNVVVITPEAAARMQSAGRFDSFQILAPGDRAAPGWPVVDGRATEPAQVLQTPQQIAREAAALFQRELGSKADTETLAAALLTLHDSAEGTR